MHHFIPCPRLAFDSLISQHERTYPRMLARHSINTIKLETGRHHDP